MEKGKKRWLLLGVILVSAMMLLLVEPKETKYVQASAVGTIKVDGYLNVRTGAGTSYGIVKAGGTKVTLSNGVKVTITGKKGSWYHIKFTQNSKTITGYVSKKYVKVQTGSVCTAVYGLVNANSVKVRKTASSTGEVVKAGKKNLSLKQAQKITILSDKLAKRVKWYKISVEYSSKTYKGYILSSKVTLSNAKSIPVIVKSTGKVSLLKNVEKKQYAKVGKEKVALSNKKQMTLLGQKVVSGQKYLYVKVTYKKKKVKGYLLDKYVFFQIVKNEDAKKTDSSKNNATTNTSGMTNAEFKSNLEDLGFPVSYVTPLMELHKQYPNWQFVPYDTQLAWSTVIEKESAVGLNLLSVNKTYAWKSTAKGAYDWTKDKYIPFDGSTWVTASEKAVKYYMDPRNFLDERGIFQFESLEYQKSYHTKAGVEKILNNTPMHSKSITYVNGSGTSKTMKYTYSQAFINGAEASGVSPYHLASRAKQEVVTGSTTMSNSVSGKVSGYKGIYNFYNIGANNSTKGSAVVNGLKWASSGKTYSRPWNTPYKSIVGGASYIGKNYINVGQNTLYLQKFNVTAKNRYNHQYMGNIEAPNSEATKTNTAYGTEKGNMSIIFSIPVYKNMPSKACTVPSGGKNPNNYLKSLSIKDHAFDSKFVLGDDGSKIYKVTVNHNVTSIKISAKKVSPYATLTGTGTKAVSVGTKTYTVKVTSESGNVRNYKIKITRKAS